MKFLLVEDDDNKSTRISEFINEKISGAAVEIARSYISGLERLVNERFDCVLLDMTLPNYDVAHDEGGGVQNIFGGRDIVRQMQRRQIYVPVIIVTQYEKFGEGDEARTREEIDAEMKDRYPDIYRGLVFYHAAMEDWKDDLLTRIGRPAQA